VGALRCDSVLKEHFDCLTFENDGLTFFVILVTIQQTMNSHISEDLNPLHNCCSNLRSNISFIFIHEKSENQKSKIMLMIIITGLCIKVVNIKVSLLVAEKVFILPELNIALTNRHFHPI
jgi:hypothetical protein